MDFIEATLPSREPLCLAETCGFFEASPVVRALSLLQDGGLRPRVPSGQVHSVQEPWSSYGGGPQERWYGPLE